MEPNVLTDTELEQLITEGFVEETVKINNKITVTFRTLTQEIADTFLEDLNFQENFTPQIITKNKLNIIVAYIYKINDKIIDTIEKKQKLLDILKKGQINLINEIFGHCINFLNKQANISLKKN